MPNYPLKSGFNRSTEHFYFFDYVVTEEAGEISFRFEVTDKRGKMAATSYNLTVKPTVIAPTSTPMVFEKIDGVLIENKIGPNQSAWDLATNVRRSGNASDADMQNPTTTATVWVKGWDGVRNTTFVKANSFDYTNASVEAAAAAFAGGTVLSSVNNVAIGDIYIARIKGQSNYPVIKVTYADGDIASSNAE